MLCLPVGLVLFTFLATCWVGPFNVDTHVLQFFCIEGRKERFHQENLEEINNNNKKIDRLFDSVEHLEKNYL